MSEPRENRAAGDDNAPTTPGLPSAATALSHVGPYRIVREIAHGGMGTVYLAVRDDDEYKQRVAVKVLRQGLESEAIVRRFRQERQVLASIEHPFIARLLDGGSTAEGLPYLVMEYIDGRPIDEFCDAQRWSIDDRLALFRKVCTAVQFAHQNLIVHRDLKPSNVLVTADGNPKLVDFGIAKPLKPELLGLTIDPTAVNLPFLTPEYASPEHIKGQLVTTTSDVYSLGVLLYELLTGHRPYRLKSRQLQEIVRVICEEEPTRPSTVVQQIAEKATPGGPSLQLTPETVSRTRETTPDRLCRKLRGDLENIVLMAMRKEPQRRYVSADQLSDDIRRYQEALPIRARKDTWSYRTSKFTRRHRVGLAAAAAVMIVLVGFSVVTATERQRAQQEADRAKAAIAFLTSTLAAVDPRLAQGVEPTVRDMLDEAERRLQGAGQLPPSEATSIREVLAESRFQLGHFKQARDHYLTLKNIYVARFGERDPTTLFALTRVAAAQGAVGDLKEAEAVARTALAGFDALRTAPPHAHINALNTLALILLERAGKEHLAEADGLLARATSLAASTLPEIEPVRLKANRLVVKLRMEQSRYLEAEPLAREGFQRTLSALGPRHPDTVEALGSLTSCLVELSRYSEALSLQREHIETARRTFGPEHAATLAAQNTYAATLRMLGRAEEAKTLYEEVLSVSTRALGERHRATLGVRHRLALTYKDLKQPVKAEEILRDVARVKRETLGPADPDTLESEGMIAVTLYEQRRLPEARDAYAEVLPRIKEVQGEGGLYLTVTVNYAGILYRLGQYQDAERILRDSVAAHERVFGAQYLRYVLHENGTGHDARASRALRRSRAAAPRCAGGFSRGLSRRTQSLARPWGAGSPGEAVRRMGETGKGRGIQGDAEQGGGGEPEETSLTD